MFTIEMLPADHGDCLWVEYGDPAAPSRVLIDTATASEETFAALVARIERVPAPRRFDLLVVTHIDDDHIGNAVRLLQSADLGCEFDDIWFNGYGQLFPSELGTAQAEALSTHLHDAKLAWNRRFAGKAAVVRDEEGFPVITLPGGMEITLLGPTREQLKKLRKDWEKKEAEPVIIRPDQLGALDIEKLAAAPFRVDASAPNGSSIAFVARYEGKSCLFAGDAHGPRLAESIGRYLSASTGTPVRLVVDALKLPHHGSRRNVSPDLLAIVEARKYLVSSNGAKHGHPDREAIARVVKENKGRGIELFFNYRSEYNAVWDDDELKAEHGFEPRYPADGAIGCVVEL